MGFVPGALIPGGLILEALLPWALVPRGIDLRAIYPRGFTFMTIIPYIELTNII